jgi:acetylornithine deacetylase/succinyl-diaminopimelate desuccinylase-like protein
VNDADAFAFARDELTALVEITSFSDQEHEAIAHIEDRCGALGLPAVRQRVEGSADNLLIGWSSRPSLLLSAHVDTIRPTWAWDGAARLDGEMLYGLGAQDDKGGAVACVLAMLLAREAGVPLERLPVGVGLCVDEELGGKGSIVMAQALRPAFAVVAEGTELDLGLAEAGFVEVWLHVRGRSVHGALREEGDNAIEKAARLVRAFHEHPDSSHEHPTLGRNIPMAQEIRGGASLNIVPDVCDVHVDWRVVPGGPTAADMLADTRELAARHDAEVEIVEVAEPFDAPADSALARGLAGAAGRVLGRPPKTIGVIAWTDAHNFAQLGGSDVAVFGPGHLRGAHRPDEHVDLREVVTCARILADLLADASLTG